MTLIKCPECKKKISDTVDKCPQCGIDLSEVSKEDLRVKEFKLDKKHISIISVVLIVLILLFLVHKMLFPANGNVNKAVRFLESEGYECEKNSSPFVFTERGEYVCEDKDNNDNRKEFTITWYGGVSNFAKNILNSGELLDSSLYLEFYFYNYENDYVFIDPGSLDEYYALVMQDEKNNDSLCTYWTRGSDEDNHIILGNNDLEVDYDNCNNSYDKYLDDLNDSLDDIRDLLKELDMD